MKGFGIDPEKDIAGRIEVECFLCGKPIQRVSPLYFGLKGNLMPKLPCHPDCLNRDSAEIALRYNQRIHDLAGVARAT
jgi:hypothetical protein